MTRQQEHAALSQLRGAGLLGPSLGDCAECGNDATETGSDGLLYCRPCERARCPLCGEKHHELDHYPIMRERAEDARERSKERRHGDW
jgi:hypothetical protein